MLKFAIWYWNTFLINVVMLQIILMCISWFFLFFFANDSSLAVYFIIILDYGNDIKQKENLSDFLIWVQNGFKAVERTCSTNSVFAQELLRNRQCSGGSSSFARKMRTWKMKSAAAGRRSLTKADWEQSSKMSHLKPRKKLPKNSTSATVWPFNI